MVALGLLCLLSWPVCQVGPVAKGLGWSPCDLWRNQCLGSGRDDFCLENSVLSPSDESFLPRAFSGRFRY